MLRTSDSSTPVDAEVSLQFESVVATERIRQLRDIRDQAEFDFALKVDIGVENITLEDMRGVLRPALEFEVVDREALRIRDSLTLKGDAEGERSQTPAEFVQNPGIGVLRKAVLRIAARVQADNPSAVLDKLDAEPVDPEVRNYLCKRVRAAAHFHSSGNLFEEWRPLELQGLLHCVNLASGIDLSRACEMVTTPVDGGATIASLERNEADNLKKVLAGEGRLSKEESQRLGTQLLLEVLGGNLEHNLGRAALGSDRELESSVVNAACLSEIIGAIENRQSQIEPN